MNAPRSGHRRIVQAQAKTSASSRARAATPTTSTWPVRPTRAISCAPTSRMQRINGIDTSAAEAAPGVLEGLHRRRISRASAAALRLAGHDKDGEPMKEPKHPALAEGKVRHVGDPSPSSSPRRWNRRATRPSWSRSTRGAARRHRPGRPLADGAPQVHDEAPTTSATTGSFGDKARVDEAIADAAHVTDARARQQPPRPNAMEPRCAIGDYDAGARSYTLYTTSQNPHVIRLLMGAFVLGIPEHKLRVVAPDVGGGFGSKIFTTPKRLRAPSPPRSAAAR
jgi:carbon-monoxide dehydrogenase large subunit